MKRILAIAALFTLPMAAQINSGVISGTVTDPQKAVVPKAKIDVIEDETKFSYVASTNEAGEYTVPYLKAGVYSITVNASGFPTFRVTGVHVSAGNTTRIDVPLQLSKVATQVEVVATADQLQIDTT